MVEPTKIPFGPKRPVICQETCVLIATGTAEEAHYLAALMNSAIIGFLVASHNVRGGKGFGSPGMLEYLNLRTFDPESRMHQQLAELSLKAHGAAEKREDIGTLQSEVNRLAAGLFGLSHSEAHSLERFVEDGQAAD